MMIIVSMQDNASSVNNRRNGFRSSVRCDIPRSHGEMFPGEVRIKERARPSIRAELKEDYTEQL